MATKSAVKEAPPKDPKLTDQEFAELAERLFTGPSPDYSVPPVVTPQMKHDSDIALREFDQHNDQAAFTRFHTEQQEAWGAVTAREQAEKLAQMYPPLEPLPPQQ